MKTSMKLAAILTMTVLATCMTLSCNSNKQDADIDLTDSVSEIVADEGLGDPCTKASLEKEVREWTRTRDHMVYYCDTLSYLQDSVEELSVECEGKEFFKYDPWYAMKNYDPRGRDSLVSIDEYSETNSVVTILIEQFGKKFKKRVNLKYYANKGKWYIEDFQVGNGGGSFRTQCINGITRLSVKLRKAEEEFKRAQEGINAPRPFVAQPTTNTTVRKPKPTTSATTSTPTETSASEETTPTVIDVTGETPAPVAPAPEPAPQPTPAPAAPAQN